MDAHDRLDLEAQSRQHALRWRLQKHVPGNVFEYLAEWDGTQISEQHIEKLCEDVYSSLQRIILEELEGLEQLDALAQEILAHDEFARDRTRHFRGRAESLKTIADYLNGNDRHPLVVWGEQGTGKSALLAKAIEQARDAHPNARMVCRFIGVTPGSSETRELLEDLCRHLSRVYGLDRAHIPSDFQELVDAFRERLELASANRRLFLFVDALDQLSEGALVHVLRWLPTELPRHVRLVVSTLPCGALSSLQAELPSASFVELGPMRVDEAEEALDLWLAEAGRTLRSGQREEVLRRFRDCPRPLYLKLAFEEARRWRSYDGPRSLSPGVQGVIGDLFGRLSEEENHGSIMVERSLGYLASAKNGLTEDELLAALSADEVVMRNFRQRSPKSPEVKQLPVVVWSRLFSDLEPYLTTRAADGTTLLAFYHPTAFRQAVTSSYLAGDSGLERHRSLALYFARRPLYVVEDARRVHDLRKLSELPYQQAQGQLWQALKATLLDFEFLDAKVRSVGPHPAIEDYLEANRCGCREASLSLVREALELSAHVLQEAPEELCSQLQGRLLSAADSDIARFLQGGRQSQAGPSLLPLVPSLTAPGSPLFRNLVGHTASVLALALTSDGRLAVSASVDGTLTVWDLRHWRQLRKVSLPPGLGDPVSDFTSASYAQELKKKYSAASLALPTTVLLLGQQAALGVAPVGSAPLSLALTRDGRLALFAVLAGKTPVTWDLEADERRHLLRGHTHPVYAVDLTADGDRAVSGGFDGVLRIWNLGEKAKGELRPMAALVGHDDAITSVAITPDARYAVSGSFDKTVRVWDIQRRKHQHTIHTGRPVLAMAVSADGQKVITAPGGKNVEVFSLQHRVSFLEAMLHRGMLRTLTGQGAPAISLAAIPDSSRVLTLSSRELKVWDIETGEHLFDLAGDLPVSAHRRAVVTPDGRFALTAAAPSNGVEVWTISTPPRARSVATHNGQVFAVAVSADGRVAVAGSLDQTVSVWDLERRTLRARLIGHNDAVMSVAIRADGRLAASGARDRTVRVWDLERGECQCVLRGHQHAVNSVAMTADGRFVLSGSADGSLRVWNVETRSLLLTLDEQSSEVRRVAMTQDARRALSASLDGSLRLWEIDLERRFQAGNPSAERILADLFEQLKKQQGKGIRLEDLGRMSYVIDDNTRLVNALALTYDGRLAAAGAADGSLSTWDLDKRKRVRVLNAAGPEIWSVAIEPGGGPLLAAAAGKNLSLWDYREGGIVASFTGENDFHACGLSENAATVVAGDSGGRIHILSFGRGV